MIFFCLLALSITACGRQTNPLLDDVESYIQQKPDSACAVLKSFDRSTLRSEEDKAHFALLYSISLDKMYIDLTEDTLINVAVDYYGNEKSRNAFMSWYYQGRVYENAKRYEDALNSYIKAESIPEDMIDPLYLGKLHFGKGRIYRYSFRDSETLEEMVLSAKYSMEAGHINNYARAVLDQADHYCGEATLDSSVAAKADSCLNIVQSLWPQLSSQRRNNWYASKILYSTVQGDGEQLKSIVDEYLEYMASSPEKVQYKTLANAYQKLGEIDLMKDALEQGVFYGQNSGSEAAAYQLLLSKAYASLGEYDSAYQHLYKYTQMLEERAYDIFLHDTQFLEERYASQLTLVKSNNRLLGLALIILVLMIMFSVLAYVLLKRKRETDETARKLQELQEEYDSLSSLSSSKSDFGAQALSVLDERMRTLKSFLEKDEIAASELDRLSGDRTVVLESIGMIYAMYAPRFTEVLISRGLTPSEIGYCCLHLMGYNTKEAGQFICYSGYYNISSRIRSKLQIEANASTLSKWLKKLYSEKEQSNI